MYYIIWQEAVGFAGPNRTCIGHVECSSPDEALRLWVERLRTLATEELCQELGVFATKADEDS